MIVGDMGRPGLDIVCGDVFGDLTIVSKSGKYCYCKCTCGKTKNIQASHLFHGRIKSCGCRLRKPKLVKSEAGFRRLFSSYKNNAIKRNLEFKLSNEQFKNLTKQNCHYCNTSPWQLSNDSKHSFEAKYLYNGIDRKDNKIGYLINNCLPCCGVCNRLKGTLSYELFIFKVRQINDNFC